MEGIHMTVFGGQPVWHLASYQLVTAHDRWMYLEQCMGHVNFVVLLLEPRLAGARFLNDVKEGCIVDWADHRVTPDQTHRMLAALGLLHMQVKHHCNDDYTGQHTWALFVFCCVQILWWGMDETLSWSC